MKTNKKKVLVNKDLSDVVAETLITTLKEMGHNLFDEYPDEDDEYGEGGYGDESEASIDAIMRDLGISDASPSKKKGAR